MIRAWLWRALDAAARALVGLVPDRLFRAVRDGRLLAPLDEADLTEGEFDEPDEPVADVAAAFDASEKHKTAPDGWACDHVTVTAGGASLISASAWCGCVLRPYYTTR